MLTSAFALYNALCFPQGRTQARTPDCAAWFCTQLCWVYKGAARQSGQVLSHIQLLSADQIHCV